MTFPSIETSREQGGSGVKHRILIRWGFMSELK